MNARTSSLDNITLVSAKGLFSLLQNLAFYMISPKLLFVESIIMFLAIHSNASICFEYIKTTIPKKPQLTNYQKSLISEMNEMDFMVKTINLSINNIPRKVVLIGENHLMSKKESEVGSKLLDTFEFVGFENAAHIMEQMPAIFPILAILKKKSPLIQNKGNELVNIANFDKNSFDLEYGVKVDKITKLRFGLLRKYWVIHSYRTDPNYSDTKVEKDFKTFHSLTGPIRDSQMANNIVKAFSNNNHITTLAVVTGMAHTQPIYEILYDKYKSNRLNSD